jgi:hypothetical protein
MQNKGIIGAVCGDIIGSAYEFHKTKDWNFKLFTPQSTFTDDTVMTCAVAEWLMDDPRHTHEQLVKIMQANGMPICAIGNDSHDSWDWINSPWPWEYDFIGNEKD